MATFAQYYEMGPYQISGTILTGDDLKLYHYAANTSSDKDVWNDRAKASVAAQPIEADANGLISFYGDGLYKLVLKDGDGDTLYTWDYVNITDNDPRGEGDAIASASTLVLGTDGDLFHVTGTTTINAISGTQSIVTLVFDDVLTITHSASLVLNGGVNYLTAAGAVKQFLNDGGGVWREIALSLDTVVVNVKIKKATPLVRWKATDGSAIEYAGGGDSGNFAIWENTGTEAVPVWAERFIYGRSTQTWALTGNFTVSGTAGITGNVTGAMKSLLPLGTGSGSAYTHEGDTTISVNQNLSGVHYYDSLTINSGVTVTVPADSGRLIIIANESITLTGTAKIDAKGGGATQRATATSSNGAAGLAGTDQAGGGGGGNSGNTGGAGGDALLEASAPSWATAARRTGATGGAIGTGAGTAPTTLNPNPNWMVVLSSWGGASGGAGGCATTSGSLGYGGAGGATVILIAPSITLGSGSIIDTSGNDGGNGNASPSIGGGGGGGAGNVYIITRTGHFTDSGTTITMSGGTGGSSASGVGAGSAGAAGQKYLFLM